MSETPPAWGTPPEAPLVTKTGKELTSEDLEGFAAEACADCATIEQGLHMRDIGAVEYLVVGYGTNDDRRFATYVWEISPERAERSARLDCSDLVVCGVITVENGRPKAVDDAYAYYTHDTER